MNNNKKEKKNKSLVISAVVLIAIIIILSGVATYFLTNNKNQDDKTLADTEIIKEMSYGNIEKLEMTLRSTSVKVKVKDIEEEKDGIKYVIVFKLSRFGRNTLDILKSLDVMKKCAPVLIIAVIPLIWFAVAAQPTVIHTFFQYRNIALTYWAVGAFICVIYNKAVA